jgi:hypothetical protein
MAEKMEEEGTLNSQNTSRDIETHMYQWKQANGIDTIVLLPQLRIHGEGPIFGGLTFPNGPRPFGDPMKKKKRKWLYQLAISTAVVMSVIYVHKSQYMSSHCCEIR